MTSFWLDLDGTIIMQGENVFFKYIYILNVHNLLNRIENLWVAPCIYS